MTTRILLEVTEFQQTRNTFWHLSGVPRTVMEIGRRLLADDDLEVVCVFYNSEASAFYHASSMLFEESDHRPRMDSPGQRRIGRRIAELVRRSLTTSGRRGARARSIRWVRRSLARTRGAEPIAFRSDDIVLALGAMWGSTELPDALAVAQRHHGFRVASLVYDLIPIRHPQYYDDTFPAQYRHYMERTLEVSDRLFVISEATGRDLAQYCVDQGVAQPPTRVVLLGDGAVSSAERHRPDRAPDGDFVLAVSTFEPRKNHQVLYHAIKQAQLSGIRLPPIVVVGSPGWLTDDLQHLVMTDPNVRDSLVWLRATTDGELAWLYANALFTVYPSIVEGWGLPIAEALTNGKFCITCDTSSMPEVGGDLVHYVSPWDVAGWVEAIHRYATDAALLAERAERIRREYHLRSWDDTAAAVKASLLDE